MAGRFPDLRRSFVASLLTLVVLLLPACQQDVEAPSAPEAAALAVAGGRGGPDFSAALAAQARYTRRLMAMRGVVGTAVGLDAEGRPAVQILTAGPGLRGLPASLDGVPVSVVVTGEIRAIPAGKGGGTTGATKIVRTARFARPVPIGISTGNAGECSAGTIGARVKVGSAVFALSNNHVYARQNAAPLGSNILQPGRYDTECNVSADDVIGTLSEFVPIVFSSEAENRVDAAIAATTTDDLGTATPSDGYGTPSATIVAAAVNQAVQKYGRTTGLTRGSVVSINATLTVGYDPGPARFVGQIMILGSKGQFARSGDSGSLIVTADRDKRPVGLLFAGSVNGYVFANPIGDVLQAFEASIDPGP